MADGPGLAMVTIGSVFVYAGIRGYSVLAVVQNAITGQPITGGLTVTPLTSGEMTPTGQSLISSGDTHASSGGNKALGMQLAGTYGWGSGAQWAALDRLWTRESGWNNKALNASSGAYGIPQALPPIKMPQAARSAAMGGSSDPASQIIWGLDYIKSRYGDPVNAWAHETSNNWY